MESSKRKINYEWEWDCCRPDIYILKAGINTIAIVKKTGKNKYFCTLIGRKYQCSTLAEAQERCISKTKEWIENLYKNN